MVYSKNVIKSAMQFVLLLILSGTIVSCAAGRKANKNRAPIAPENTLVGTQHFSRSALVKYAKSFEGVPYKWGGNSPVEGFDCSGYVKYVFTHFDIAVPRVTHDYANFGKRIDLKKARIGDLILFSLYDDKSTIGHIGIISSVEGTNIKFLHAASGAKSHKVMESDLAGVHLSRMLFVDRVVED